MRNDHNIPKAFNLLRWFSLASLLALIPVGAATAFVLSYFITQDTLHRDAVHTALFLQKCIELEGRHMGLRNPHDLVNLMDKRADPARFGVSALAVTTARAEFHEHLRSLPDVLLVNLFLRDGRIIWSTNPALVGSLSKDNPELTEAFNDKLLVARHHASRLPARSEQKFLKNPQKFFIENYVPLMDNRGSVVLVAEVYKEPQYLQVAIDRGRIWVWGTTLLAAALMYFGLFSVVRHGSRLLLAQERRLREADAMVFVGEMSSAIAHGLRNPLASIRSSAELAQLTSEPLARKNASDIIAQVDVLARWIRELLSFSRPVTGEPEAVDLVATLDNVLEGFATPFAQAGITLTWSQRGAHFPKIDCNSAMLTQALHSIVANALEAMPQGGELAIALSSLTGDKHVELLITDTGCGMSASQLAQAFKPFHTTKRNGVGVGLSLVQRVMERFGGTVTLASQALEGTQVRLVFRAAGGERNGQTDSDRRG